MYFVNVLQSIRFRIVIACVLFSIVVTISYGWVTFKGVKYNSDELFNWCISQEVDLLLKRYQDDVNTDFQSYTTAQIRIDTERNVLQELAGYFPNEIDKRAFTKAKSLEQVSLLGPKFKTAQGYTIYEYSAGDITVHVLKSANLRTTTQHFYYIVDVTDFINYDNNSEKMIFDMFVRILIVILVLAMLIGFILARMVVAPLTHLADSVDQTDCITYTPSEHHYFNDEIGYLAKRIDQFMIRTNRFVAREKAFSREVSHELRTPLASSRAALDVARTLSVSSDKPLAKCLDRMYRANKDMSHLIETFYYSAERSITHKLYLSLI